MKKLAPHIARIKQGYAGKYTGRREHRPGCPRLQFWDAGEGEAPCTCPYTSLKDGSTDTSRLNGNSTEGHHK